MSAAQNDRTRRGRRRRKRRRKAFFFLLLLVLLHNKSGTLKSSNQTSGGGRKKEGERKYQAHDKKFLSCIAKVTPMVSIGFEDGMERPWGGSQKVRLEEEEHGGVAEGEKSA